MPDKKKDTSKSRGRSTAGRKPSMRERAEAVLAKAKRNRTIKGGSAANMSGLAARIAAGLAQNLGKAAPAAAQGAAKVATKTSPWVTRAAEGKLPTKDLTGVVSGGAVVGRATPAKSRGAKAMKQMPKKAAPKATSNVAKMPGPKRRATPQPKREGASSNTYNKKSAKAKSRVR